jgi:5-methylcytosine-specific restriction endonuclease McrA
MRMPWELAESWKPGDRPIGAVRRPTRRISRRGWLRQHLGKPCPYCGVTMNRSLGWNGPQAPSRDHQVPRSRKGPHVAANILVCCRACNEEKGCLTHEEFAAVRAGLASRYDHVIHRLRGIASNPNARVAREVVDA